MESNGGHFLLSYISVFHLIFRVILNKVSCPLYLVGKGLFAPMNALITLKLFILRGKCISSPVRTLPTCRISTIRVSRSCLSATHRKSLSGQKDECVRIKKSIIVVSAPKGSNRLSCSGSEMSDDTNYYSDSEMDLYEEENDEIDDEEEEEEVAGLGSDGPNDVVMHAVHEYFSVMEKVSLIFRL